MVTAQARERRPEDKLQGDSSFLHQMGPEGEAQVIKNFTH